MVKGFIWTLNPYESLHNNGIFAFKLCINVAEAQQQVFNKS